MLLALKKTQSGQAGSTPASLQAWGTSFSPVPLLPAASEPPPPGSSVPLLPASLSISPDGLFLHSLPQLPGLCWSLGSTLTSASPSNAVDQGSPNPTIPPKGAADRESSLTQVRKHPLPPPSPQSPQSHLGPWAGLAQPHPVELPSPWVWDA